MSLSLRTAKEVDDLKGSIVPLIRIPWNDRFELSSTSPSILSASWLSLVWKVSTSLPSSHFRLHHRLTRRSYPQRTFLRSVVWTVCFSNLLILKIFECALTNQSVSEVYSDERNLHRGHFRLMRKVTEVSDRFTAHILTIGRPQWARKKPKVFGPLAL